MMVRNTENCCLQYQLPKHQNKSPTSFKIFIGNQFHADVFFLEADVVAVLFFYLIAPNGMLH